MQSNFEPGQHPLLGHEQVGVSVNERKIGHLGAISPALIRLGQLSGPAYYATFAISDLFANPSTPAAVSGDIAFSVCPQRPRA
jgi:phenylalanyl-tRNA synthetase beta subunit